MTITKATLNQVYEVTVFMKQFEDCTEHVKVNVEYATQRYKDFISLGIGDMLVLRSDDGKILGGLGCIASEDLHNGDRIAIETFWFVAPEYRGGGLLLLNAFDNWAKEKGCIKKAMIHLEDSFPETLKKLYIRKGYKFIESHYVAEVI